MVVKLQKTKQNFLIISVEIADNHSCRPIWVSVKFHRFGPATCSLHVLTADYSGGDWEGKFPNQEQFNRTAVRTNKNLHQQIQVVYGDNIQTLIISFGSTYLTKTSDIKNKTHRFIELFKFEDSSGFLNLCQFSGFHLISGIVFALYFQFCN